MSFFHGVTTTAVDTGARTISLPSSSIIGLCDTFSPGLVGGGTAKAGELKLITTEREAIAAFGADSAITKACQAIYAKAKAVIVAIGVPKMDDPALQTWPSLAVFWSPVNVLACRRCSMARVCSTHSRDC